MDDEPVVGGRGKADALAAREDRVALLASMGRRHKDIADEVKISERQIRRILERPEARAKVAQLRAAALERAGGQLADLAVDAVDHLAILMRSDTVQDTVRLAAARAILTHALAIRDAVDVDARLAALEELAAQQDAPVAARWAA